MKLTYAILVALLLVWSCSTPEEKCAPAPDTSRIQVKLRIESFEDSLANIQTKDQLVSLLTREPLLRDYLFRRTEYSNDSVFINRIYSRLTHPGIDTLLLETRRVFGDLSGLRTEFENAFRNILYYYPDFRVPKIKTVISGLDTDLLVTDSLIIVGLDFYLGKDARYRPAMYDYLLRKYEPEDIVPSCMLLYGIGDNLNKTTPSDKTVLADMVAYGKAFYFAKQMLPCTPDSTLISYTSEEMEGSRKNQDLIWARFIDSEVLYSTSHLVKKDYLGERPATLQVGEKCPGRIGQWVGWQIVRKYMETHPAVTLPELMAAADAQKLFKESRYKPQRR